MKKFIFLIITLLIGIAAQATVQTVIRIGGVTRTNGNNSMCIWVVESDWGSDQQSQTQGSSYTFNNYVIGGTGDNASITLNGTLTFAETASSDVTTGSVFSVIIESNSRQPLWFYGATVKNRSDENVTGCNVSTSGNKHTLTVTFPANKDFSYIVVDYVANAPFSSGNTVISDIDDDYLFSGDPIEPEPTVTYNGIVLTKGTDYTVSYSGSNRLGNATVIVTGTGNYAGTIQKFYTLRDVDLRDFNSLGNNIYEIATTTDLDYLARYVKAGNYGNNCDGLTFLQTADIAYSYTTEWDHGGETNFTSVGVYGKPFKGTYDGQNNTVSGIRIQKYGKETSDESQGLFGYVGGGGTVKNVVLANTYICGYTHTGGLVGYNSGTIEDCRVENNVLTKSRATTSVGGIAGICAFGGTVNRCTFKGTTQFISSPSSDIGGIVGTLSDNCTVSNCLVLGASISGDNNYTGAIAGNNTGTLTANYYHNCEVSYSNNTAATVNVGVGLEGGSEDQDGARSVHALTLPDCVTATGESVEIDGTNYYAAGTTVTLSYSGEVPNLSVLIFNVNGTAIEGNTFVMPPEDVEVVTTFIGVTRYTFDPATGELALIRGEFNKYDKWGNDVPLDKVLSVTATDEVSFAGDCSNLFLDFTNCTIMDLSNVNTEGVTDLYGMFYNCKSLESLDLSGWTTDSVTNMSDMFNGCQNIGALDISGWNTANVTNMSSMFLNCQSLDWPDLSGWNTASVTNMGSMFVACKSLELLDLSGWNTASVTNMSYMFYGCENMSVLDLSGWNTANVTNMSNMFNGCKGFSMLDLSGWNTASVTNMGSMFYNCESLVSIFAGSCWNTGNVQRSNSMFDGCTFLSGGMGTEYSSSHIDAEYARIDRGADVQPGYLTGVYALTLADDITASPAATLTHDDVNLYAAGTEVTLAYDGEMPADYAPVYSVNGTDIEGDTFEMPFENVTVGVTMTKVMSWSDLKTALEAGQSVTLTNDVIRDISETIYVTGTVTLDLNGYTLDGNSPNCYNSILCVNDGGSLTITDSQTGGNICKAGSNPTVNVMEGCSLTLAAGTINAQSEGVIVENGSFAMTGGTITGAALNGVYLAGNGTFTMSGGSITGNMVGVCFETYGREVPTFTVSGNVNIMGNTEEDVLLTGRYVKSMFNITPITIGGALDEAARIGINIFNGFVEEITGNVVKTVTSGFPGNGTRENFVMSSKDGLALVISASGELAIAHAYTLTVPENVTASGFTAETDGTYKVGYSDVVTLCYDGEIPEGYPLVYSVNGTAIEGNTFTMPAEDATVTVNGLYVMPGDVNGDGIVNVNDITVIVAKTLGGNPQPFIFEAADLDHDGVIGVTDITALVTLLL